MDAWLSVPWVALNEGSLNLHRRHWPLPRELLAHQARKQCPLKQLSRQPAYVLKDPAQQRPCLLVSAWLGGVSAAAFNRNILRPCPRGWLRAVQLLEDNQLGKQRLRAPRSCQPPEA